MKSNDETRFLRIIPKPLIKIKDRIMKRFSWKDLFFMFVMAVIAFSIALPVGFQTTPLTGAIIAMVFILLSWLLLRGEDEKVYSVLFKMFKAIPQTFKKEKISDVILFNSIQDNIINVDNKQPNKNPNYIYNKNLYLYRIKGFSFELLQPDELEQKIQVLRHFFKETKTVSFWKLDRNISVQSQKDFINKRLHELNSEKQKPNKLYEYLLEDEKEDLEILEQSEGSFLPTYYLCFYEKNQKKAKEKIEEYKNWFNEAGFKLEEASTKETHEVTLKMFYGIEKKWDESSDNFKQYSGIESITFKKKIIKINNVYQKIIAISEFPSVGEQGYLSDLFLLPDIRIVFNTEPLNYDDARKMILKYKILIDEKINKRYTNLFDSINDERGYEDIIRLVEDIASGNEVLLNTGLYVIINADTEKDLSVKTRTTVREIRKLGFNIDLLDYDQKDALSTITPNLKNMLNKKCELQLTSDMLAASYPFKVNGFMDPQGSIFGFTPDGHPVAIDFNYRNRDREQANAIVFGRSGSGKSTFLKMMAVKQLTRGNKVIILDPQSEYKSLAKNFNSQLIEMYFDELDENQVNINPFQPSDFFSHFKDAIQDHGGLLSDFMNIVLFNSEATNIEKALIDKSIQILYKTWDWENTKTNDQMPCFDNYLSVLNILKEQTSNTDHKLIYDKMILISETYCKDGSYEFVWNKPTDINIVESDLTIIDFLSLFKKANENIKKGQLLLVISMINSFIYKNWNKTTMFDIIIDELHMFTKDVVIKNWIDELYRTVRKLKGRITSASQKPQDFVSIDENGRGSVNSNAVSIIENSEMMFALGMKSAGRNALDVIVQDIKELTGPERSLLSQKRAGYCLFMPNDEERHSMIIEVSDLLLELWDDNKQKPSSYTYDNKSNDELSNIIEEQKSIIKKEDTKKCNLYLTTKTINIIQNYKGDLKNHINEAINKIKDDKEFTDYSNKMPKKRFSLTLSKKTIADLDIIKNKFKTTRSKILEYLIIKYEKDIQ